MDPFELFLYSLVILLNSGGDPDPSGVVDMDVPRLGQSLAAFQQVGSFDPIWNNSISDDGGAALLLTGLESMNFTYPAFTYDELALPKMQLSSGSQKQMRNFQNG
jgi:hypothetical protein